MRPAPVCALALASRPRKARTARTEPVTAATHSEAPIAPAPGAALKPQIASRQRATAVAYWIKELRKVRILRGRFMLLKPNAAVENIKPTPSTTATAEDRDIAPRIAPMPSPF